MRGIMNAVKRRPWLSLGVGLALVGLSCSLDKVTTPPLGGPSVFQFFSCDRKGLAPLRIALSVMLTPKYWVCRATGKVASRGREEV